jgi:hypothetical protein
MVAQVLVVAEAAARSDCLAWLRVLATQEPEAAPLDMAAQPSDAHGPGRVLVASAADASRAAARTVYAICTDCLHRLRDDRTCTGQR